MKTTIILLVCFLSFSVYSQDKKNKHNVRLYLSGNLSNDVKQTTIKKATFNGFRSQIQIQSLKNQK